MANKVATRQNQNAKLPNIDQHDLERSKKLIGNTVRKHFFLNREAIVCVNG